MLKIPDKRQHKLSPYLKDPDANATREFQLSRLAMTWTCKPFLLSKYLSRS